MRRTASMSPRGAKSTLAVALNGARIAGLSVADTAPDVRPWKARSKASTLARPVANDASLMAFSFASAPELHRNSEYES